MRLAVRLLLLQLLWRHSAPAAALCDQQFVARWLPDCVSADYVRVLPAAVGHLGCAIACHSSPLCKAFTFNATTACRLMEFNACSFGLVNASCTDTNLVFVRRLPGLQPPRLCSHHYTKDTSSRPTGRMYRKTATKATAEENKAACDAEPGVVKFADVEDREEATAITNSLALDGGQFWVAAFQTDTSDEPSGNWIWSSCGNAVDSSLWESGQPNDDPAQQQHAWLVNGQLVDKENDYGSGSVGVCECLDPFY